jgi:DNA-binding MarR family transcriptional regulator
MKGTTATASRLVREREFIEGFLDFARLLQERNQFIVRAYDTDMLPVEFHILVELDNHSALTGAELSIYLGISTARLSLILKKMRSRKLIKIETDTNNARRKPFAITSYGRDLLNHGDRLADQRLTLIGRDYESYQISRMAELLGAIADQLGIAPSKKRSREHPLRSPIRRLTRWLGLLGNNFFESDLSPLEWHIIAALAQDGEDLTGRDLSSRFGASKQLISKVFKGLTKRGLITPSESEQDKRVRFWRVTESGSRLLANRTSRCSLAIDRAMRGIPSKLKDGGVFSDLFSLAGLQTTKTELKITRITDSRALAREAQRFLETANSSNSLLAQCILAINRATSKDQRVDATSVTAPSSKGDSPRDTLIVGKISDALGRDTHHFLLSHISSELAKERILNSIQEAASGDYISKMGVSGAIPIKSLGFFLTELRTRD